MAQALRRIAAACALAAAVAACAADIDKARKIQPTGGDFNSWLAKDYRDLAVYKEDGVHDYDDSKLFAKKALDALAGKAAQLAHIPLAGPPSVIGRNTEHSMQSGLVLGHVAMVEGLLDRMRGLEHRRGVPVVILTAKGQDADRDEAFNLGADDFVTKPFSPKKLLARIDEILDRG